MALCLWKVITASEQAEILTAEGFFWFDVETYYGHNALEDYNVE